MFEFVDQIMNQVFQLDLSKEEQTDFSYQELLDKTKNHKKCKIKISVCSPMNKNLKTNQLFPLVFEQTLFFLQKNKNKY